MTTTSRAAFSLAEVVVALALIGVATATLATALAGDRRLRALAIGHQAAADRARLRLETFASRRCAGDTSGASREPWGEESWRASVSSGAWRLTDTLVLPRLAHPLVVEAQIVCPR